MKLYKKKTIIDRESGAAYMVRYTLFNCRWFSVKVHNILLSDYDCMHDHPWAFITLILRGGYVEHTPQGSEIMHPGDCLYRPANYIHRLEIHQPAWTFVVTFRKVKPWGFFTKQGWVEWMHYTPTQGCE